MGKVGVSQETGSQQGLNMEIPSSLLTHRLSGLYLLACAIYILLSLSPSRPVSLFLDLSSALLWGKPQQSSAGLTDERRGVSCEAKLTEGGERVTAAEVFFFSPPLVSRGV